MFEIVIFYEIYEKKNVYEYDYVRYDCNVNDVFLILYRLVFEFSLIGYKMVMLLKFLLRFERNWKMLKLRYSKLK